MQLTGEYGSGSLRSALGTWQTRVLLVALQLPSLPSGVILQVPEESLPKRPSSVAIAVLGLALLPFGTCAQAPPSAKGQEAKKPMVGPPAPQSTHYPILLLAFGSEPGWSLRIGQKGPERLDRPGYPPIPLEPAEVTHEAAADTWTYHAKDSATGAAVAVHLSRETCSPTPAGQAAAAPAGTETPALAAPVPPAPVSRYPFTASVDHAQIGTLQGCARIATELFPKINNQPDQDDEDDKKKPPAPTITNFKPPVAVAYVSPDMKMVFKRGTTIRVIPGKPGYELSVSRDGKKLLFTRDESSDSVRTINLYDFDSNTVKELLRGSVHQPFWSPDGTEFAFLKFVDGKWNLWHAPTGPPESAASVYPGEVMSIHGWADARTILVDDFNQLSWVGIDGVVQRSVPLKEVYGDVFGKSSANKIRIHPLNPDLLLISGEIPNPPPGMPKDPHMGGSMGFCLYEIRSKRRTLLTPPNMFAQDAEWSRDGLQIFFTSTDSSRHSVIYRMFWDGTGLQKYATGTALVIGQ